MMTMQHLLYSFVTFKMNINIGVHFLDSSGNIKKHNWHPFVNIIPIKIVLRSATLID